MAVAHMHSGSAARGPSRISAEPASPALAADSLPLGHQGGPEFSDVETVILKKSYCDRVA